MADKAERKILGSGRKLASPYNLTWPQLTDKADRSIVDALKRVFAPLICLRQEKKAFTWKRKKPKPGTIDQSSHEGQKVAETSRSNAEPCKMDTDTSSATLPATEPSHVLEERQKIKSLLSVGAQKCLRGLERRELRLVLVWRDTQPMELKKAVLLGAYGADCPAVCVSDILSPVQASWNMLTSLTVLGFKKTEEPNLFDEFVKQVIAVAPVLNFPELPKETEFSEKRKVLESSSSESSTPKSKVTETAIEKGTNVKTPVLPPVNVEKYYIYKDTLPGKQGFGEDFIKFDDVLPEISVDIIDGKPVRTSDPTKYNKKPKLYSIASNFGCKPNTRSIINTVPSKKRKINLSSMMIPEDEKPPSNYKSINVKVPNIENMRKKTKKTKPQKGKQGTGRKKKP